MPRVWLAYSAQPTSVDDALNQVISPEFDPTKTLHVSGDLSPAQPGGSGSAAVVDYQDDRVTVHVSTNQPAYLVLADTAYPGWNATVDGSRTPIATADGIFRAVAVPAGAHDVVFRFEPSIVTKSVIISIISCHGAALDGRCRRLALEPGAARFQDGLTAANGAGSSKRGRLRLFHKCDVVHQDWRLG